MTEGEVKENRIFISTLETGVNYSVVLKLWRIFLWSYCLWGRFSLNKKKTSKYMFLRHRLADILCTNARIQLCESC